MERYRSIVLHGVSLEICDRMNILKYSLLVTWILDFCMIMLVILDEDSGVSSEWIQRIPNEKLCSRHMLGKAT